MAINPTDQIANVSIGLVCVIGFIYLLAFLIKKSKTNKLINKDVKIESFTHINNKAKLMVVNISGQRMLLGVTNESINPLCMLSKSHKNKVKEDEQDQVMFNNE